MTTAAAKLEIMAAIGRAVDGEETALNVEGVSATLKIETTKGGVNAGLFAPSVPVNVVVSACVFTSDESAQLLLASLSGDEASETAAVLALNARRALKPA